MENLSLGVGKWPTARECGEYENIISMLPERDTLARSMSSSSLEFLPHPHHLMPPAVAKTKED